MAKKKWKDFGQKRLRYKQMEPFRIFFSILLGKKRVSLKVQVVSVIHSGILKIKLFRGIFA